MSNDSIQPQHEISFAEFKQVLFRRKWTIFVCLAVALMADGAAILYLPVLYRTTVRIFAPPKPTNEGFSQLTPEQQVEVQPQAPEVQDQVEVLQGSNLLLQAFGNAGVSVPIEALDPESKANPVSVKEQGISNIVDISVDLQTPDESDKVAEQIPKVFSSYLSTGEASDFARTVGFLTDKLQTEQTRLDAATAAYGKFKSTHDYKALGPTEQSERSARLSRVLSDYQTSLGTLADAKNKYDSLVADRKKQPLIIPSPSVQQNFDRKERSKLRLNDLREKLADARSIDSEDNPAIVSLLKQISIEQAYLDALPDIENNHLTIRNPALMDWDRDVAQAKSNYDGAKAASSKFGEEVTSESKSLQDYSAAQPAEQKLLNEIALRTQTVQELSKQLDIVRVRTTSSHDPVTVLSISVPQQVQPAPLKYTIIAIIVGLALGIGAALTKDKFDDRVYSMDQIYTISGIPPLGQLPSAKKTLALTSGAGRNALLENYRALRFNLDSIGQGEDAIKSVLVASPSGLERRPDVAYNLAVEAATDQRQTILVDADLRNPKLHEQMGLRLAPGLSDVLRGTVTLEEALQTTSNSKLKLLSAGSPEPDPLELFTSPEMEALHEQLKAQADVIILNSASLLRHADARALAKILDSVLFVARSGATKMAALRYCVDLLRRAKAPFLGIVLSESGGYSDIPYYGRD